MPTENFVFAFLGAFAIYLIFIGVLNLFRRREKVAAGLAQETAAEDIVLSDSLFGLGRVAGPSASSLGARVFRDDPETVEARLRRSGWRYKSVMDFYGSKILMAVVLFVVFTIGAVALQLNVTLIILAAVVGGALGLFNADIEVNRTIANRRKALYREMAWTLDRLAIMMESGSALTSGMNDLIRVSKGRGGLFLGILRQIAGDQKGGSRDPKQIVAYISSVMPELPELDTFLQLMRISLDESQPIAIPLRTLARSMRDELTNQIEARRQAAEMRIVIITAAIVVPVLLLLIGGPVLLTVNSVLR